MTALLPLWVASSVAGTVGLPVTASVGLVGVLAALGSKSQKSNESCGDADKGTKLDSTEVAQESETSTAIEEEEQPKVCLSHALSSFTPRCHPIDQDITGATWDTVYPSRQPSQVVAEAAVTQAALTQQQGLPKQRSQRYRKLVHGLSARLSTLCHPACLAPKTGHTAAAQRAAKQTAAGKAVSWRGRGGKQPKLDMLRTASSLQQRISIVASSASGQRAAQGAIAAFHVPSRHLSSKRKQGPWIAHLC
ncbi:hypothetical protein WJX75_006825 [Coccomyxa subellipsoidea]|uniref:Uncharacterized protein n=1 Tax=Coccomyxa subellipsoidea TaxID=248742 RepID=A0ABR2YZB7_9CHLO